MPRKDNVYELPENLPAPVDDGGCDHLTVGLRLPSVPLPSTGGRTVDLAGLSGWAVVYCYPRTGRPDQEPPSGWNEIPGARGCTPQSCAFRDRHRELQRLGVEVFGLSTQETGYQKEAVKRLHLPFELLSDAELAFVRALRLPTFAVESMILIKRLTLILSNGRIEKVFYPVFPPDRNAGEVIGWLSKSGNLQRRQDMKETVKRLDAEYGFQLTEEEVELIAKQAEEANRLFEPLFKVDVPGVAPIMKVDKRIRRNKGARR